MQSLPEALERGWLTIEEVKIFPVFEEYQDDTDLQRLLSNWQANQIHDTSAESLNAAEAGGMPDTLS